MKDSIEKEAISIFWLAVQWLSHKYWQELRSKFKCKRMTFCILNHEKTLKIILNGHGERSDYPVTLNRSLEVLDKWATSRASKEYKAIWSNNWATSHASEEQKAVWSNSYNRYLKTCIKGVEGELSFHEVMEVFGQLHEKDPKLCEDLESID